MKVLQLNFSDINGGAARAAYRIHQALRTSGLTMLVSVAESGDWTVAAPGSWLGGVMARIRPHPSKYAIEEIKRYPNIQYVAELSNYDCLISTDVIEHVPDPLITFSQMIKSINMHGFLIIANNFSPVIKCHLPQTFHLKYTFNQFAKIMGLSVIGRLSGSHALIFKKVASNKKIGPKIRFYEYVSKKLYPINKFSRAILRPVKRFFAR